jgi:hypothetical protein
MKFSSISGSSSRTIHGPSSCKIICRLNKKSSMIKILKGDLNTILSNTLTPIFKSCKANPTIQRHLFIQCGFSLVSMRVQGFDENCKIANWKKIIAMYFSMGLHDIRPLSRLQEKPQVLKRDHPALQKNTFLNFFLFLIMAHLAPNPDPHSAYPMRNRIRIQPTEINVCRTVFGSSRPKSI